MPSELLNTNPETLAIVALAVLISFACGWFGRGSGARRSEGNLKRSILEAKGSIPQLESNLRKRETQVETLEAQINELDEQIGEANSALQNAEHELRASNREARNLRSELEALKGVSAEAANVIDFEDEEEKTDTDPRLARTQALYDKLKAALIERDEHIDQLQARLDAPTEDGSDAATTEPIGQPLPSTSDASPIAEPGAGARIADLEEQVDLREQTIAAREGSIKRLLSDLESMTKAKQVSDTEREHLSEAHDRQAEELDEQRGKISTLELSVGQRDARIHVLDQDLRGVRAQLEALREAASEAGASSPGPRERETEDLKATLKQQERWLAKLKDSLAQRDTKLAAAEAEATAARAHAASLAQSLRLYQAAVTEHEVDVAAHNPAQVVPLRTHRKRPRRHGPKRSGARAPALPFRPQRRLRRRS